MSATTKIEWTDATWNPVTGYTKVSPGCDNCYAETLAERFRGTGGHYFEQGFDVTLRPEKLLEPLRWRKPRRVFVNSMSDLFHASVPDEYVARVWAVMALAPQHTFQVLTKRHGRLRALLSSPQFRELCEAEWNWLVGDESTPMPQYRRDAFMRQWWSEFSRPLRNVWLGVSAEDQERADLRVPALLETPAAVRFLSCEPLLGPIDLEGPLDGPGTRRQLTYWLTGRPGVGAPSPTLSGVDMRPLTVGPRLDWVIAGGESGRGARPMHPDWARRLRDQCQQAGVPFLFKQWGEYVPTGYLVIGGTGSGTLAFKDPVDELGHRVEVRRVGKGRAGRELDGRVWDEFPTPSRARGGEAS
ncbi:DUF5131 family protein [Streptomyces sp. NBRC 109706]|uniref:DUF5131 family protein n=1 Tax=Streptomyces sp. NBRC 109706 TaxID=1550035 RepID=UPI0007835472|nr:phage Gp37/Gp68 family protein [Streptomyces sp. NBRC 109706]